MNALIYLLAIALVVVAFVFLRNLRRTAPAVTLGDVPAVFDALVAGGTDGSFAVLLFAADGMPAPAGDSLNVQFSVENGVAGIDWVLVSPFNKDAEPKFVEFFERQAMVVQRREGHDVKYRRVEGAGLAQLVQGLLRDEFGVKPDQRMDLIADGFTWSPGSSRTSLASRP